jgi:hypothetical protein
MMIWRTFLFSFSFHFIWYQNFGNFLGKIEKLVEFTLEKNKKTPKNSQFLCQKILKFHQKKRWYLVIQQGWVLGTHEAQLMMGVLIAYGLLSHYWALPHRDRDYCIGSNFWKFYLIRTRFILSELVFFWWKCLDYLDWKGFFWCSECGHSK